MYEWYYVKDGQQLGPVSLEQLRELASAGTISETDLVWSAAMTDWTPASQVSGIFSSTAVTHPDDRSAMSTDVSDIIPGSEPIDPIACIKRAFELTKRHFSIMIGVLAVYMCAAIGLSVIQSLITGALTSSSELSGVALIVTVLTIVIQQIATTFLNLGLIRVALNLVSGKAVQIGMLFGEGSKLLRAIGATILIGIMVFIGFILLIIPGIYLALRFSQVIHAIVDRDMGIADAFAYSTALTTNNKLNILVIGILSTLIILAGFLALFVGLIFAIPMVWIVNLVAYRWMQYGARGIQDPPFS